MNNQNRLITQLKKSPKKNLKHKAKEKFKVMIKSDINELENRKLLKSYINKKAGSL